MESAIVTCLQGNRWNHILQLCSVMVSHIDAWTLMFVSPFGPLLACVERYLLLVMQSDCLVSCSDAITGCASLSALCTEMTAARSCWSGAPELPLQTVGLQTHNRMTQSPKLEFLSASAFCYTCSDTSRIITAVSQLPRGDTYIASQCIRFNANSVLQNHYLYVGLELV